MKLSSFIPTPVAQMWITLGKLDLSRRKHHAAGTLRQRRQIHFLHAPTFVA